MPDLADRARLVYQSNRERLWIWNPASKDWYKPAFWAVSGGGRGQLLKAGGHDVSLPYGVNEGRKHVARFSNFGGGKGGDPANYGPIPNGLFEVGVPRHDSALGRCAELKPIQGLMMGRHSFYIHGQGKTGSEGCIVPVHGRLEQVLHLVTLLRSKGPLYLRVEGSDTLDLPDKPSDTFVA